MALFDTIQTALRAVPGYLAPTSSWSYRKMTSGPGVPMKERTYTAWITVDAHVTGRTTTEDFDAQGKVRRREVARFRVSSAVSELHQGDQVRDSSGNGYAVMGIVSSGIGTTAYMIEVEKPLKAESVNHGGGV